MNATPRFDIAYRAIDSPIGPLLLAATPKGLARVAFKSDNHRRVLADLAREFGGAARERPEQLAAAKRQFDDYFAGDRETFDLPLDLGGVSGFNRDVLDQLAAIAYGATATYGQIAAQTGFPRMAREVGEACGSNPLPIVIPCHRVVRTGGGLGGYRGGGAAKRTLLDLESKRARPVLDLVLADVI